MNLRKRFYRSNSLKSIYLKFNNKTIEAKLKINKKIYNQLLMGFIL